MSPDPAKPVMGARTRLGHFLLGKGSSDPPATPETPMEGYSAQQKLFETCTYCGAYHEQSECPKLNEDITKVSAAAHGKHHLVQAMNKRYGDRD